MIIFSVVLYLVLAIVFLMGKPKTQRFSMGISTCCSSFFSMYFYGFNYIATLIYFIMGIVSIFFYWVTVDSIPKEKSKKGKGIAVLLAIFFGVLGIHRLYLRQGTRALFYVLLSWTGISTLISLIDIIVLVLMKENTFDKKYNNTELEYGATQSYSNSGIASPKVQSNDDTNSLYFNKSLVNERDGDNLNYNDIRLCGYQAKAIGNVEDFVITVYKDGQMYNFKSKGGNICSVRSSSMRNTKTYEVAQ